MAVLKSEGKPSHSKGSALVWPITRPATTRPRFHSRPATRRRFRKPPFAPTASGRNWAPDREDKAAPHYTRTKLAAPPSGNGAGCGLSPGPGFCRPPLCRRSLSRMHSVGRACDRVLKCERSGMMRFSTPVRNRAVSRRAKSGSISQRYCRAQAALLARGPKIFPAMVTRLLLYGI
jgi:hypothetical protein